MRKKMDKIIKNRISFINLVEVIIIMTICVVVPNNSFAATKSSTKKSTTQEPQKQLELKSLSIDNYELYPEFNSNTTVYYISISTDEKSVEINCEANVEDANIKITGNKKLTKTENLIQINLTKTGYTPRTYEIYATKQSDNGPKLSSLSIDGAEMTPQFEKNKYYYDANLRYTNNIETLNISAVSDDSDAKVEILGNSADLLKDGDNNIITIMVSDSKNTTVYQVNVTLQKTSIINVVNTPDENDYKTKIKETSAELYEKTKGFYEENQIPFLVASSVIIVLIIILIAVHAHKKKIIEERQRMKDRV